MNNDTITRAKITKTEYLTGLINTILLHAQANLFLISSCQSFHQKSNTNSAFSYRFPIDGNLSFCFISVWGGAVRRARAGCNLSQAAVCENYLLHGSAVANRYLYPGCQMIGFPPLTLSDIRWSSAVCSESMGTVCVCVCVCVCVDTVCVSSYGCPYEIQRSV